MYRASRGRYGAPRILAELAAQGVACDKKTVAKLMRQAQLSAKPARRFRLCTTDSNHDFPPARNLLGRNFSARGPNRIWGADLTYLATDEGWLYLAIVEDFYSRKIVGYATSSRLDCQVAVRALRMAVRARLPRCDQASSVREIARPTERHGGRSLPDGVRSLPDGGRSLPESARSPRKRPSLIVHSDRGVQFASDEFAGLLGYYGLSASMSRRGNCWDNAPVESFLATLKKEHVHQADYRSRGAAREGVRRYIERFYNCLRRHSALGYLSPDEFEQARLRDR